jgi:hypothetical protein
MTSNTAKRFLQLGQAIRNQRSLILTYSGAADVLRRTIAERELTHDLLQPDGKWPGSNEEARRLSRKSELAGDEDLVRWGQSLLTAQENLRMAQHALQLLEDEQKALQLAMQVETLDVTMWALSQGTRTTRLAEDWDQMANHPAAQDCPEPECSVCAERDCPNRDSLHYHHDGCPSCYQPTPAEAQEPWVPEDDGIDSPVVMGNIYPVDEERLGPKSSIDDIPF